MELVLTGSNLFDLIFLGLAARGAGGAGTGAWAAGGTGTGAGARGAEAGFAGDAIAIVIEPGLAALECLPGLLLSGVVGAAGWVASLPC